MTKTTFKPLPIILDRLSHALDAQGIKLKRSQLLEIAAGAFGHRNSNELTAAAKAGEINPYPAKVIGRVKLPDDQNVIIVNDQLGNMPYAIDETFLEQVAAEERREEIGITPYGHLAALYDVLDTTYIPEIAGGQVISEVHVGRVSHKHGENIYVAADYDGLTMQVAEYVRENWHEIAEYANIDENPEIMTDEEVVEAYFDLCQEHSVEEYLETSVEKIEARLLPVPKEAPTTPRRYGLQYEMDDEPIFIIDRHVKYKNEEYATVAQIPRTSDPQVDIALAQKIIDGLNGDSVPAIAPDHYSASDLMELADELESGAVADHWYDAHEYMDETDPTNSDTIAHNAICNTQEAMTKTASLLREMLRFSGENAKDGSDQKPDDQILKRQQNSPIWITDSIGDYTDQVTASHMEELSLTYEVGPEENKPLTKEEHLYLLEGEELNEDSNNPVFCGYSVLYKNQKWIAPEVRFSFDPDNEKERENALLKAKSYFKEKESEIKEMDGHVLLFENETDSQHIVVILIPFYIAQDSESPESWKKALGWLMQAKAERNGPQVICDFLSQVWMNDNAYSVDPNGDTCWDGTFDAIRWGHEFALKCIDTDMDEFVTQGTMVPEWIKDWSKINPYEVTVLGLEELFEI